MPRRRHYGSWAGDLCPVWGISALTEDFMNNGAGSVGKHAVSRDSSPCGVVRFCFVREERPTAE